MNLPNKLTLSRFVLTVVFLAVMFSQFRFRDTVALLLFSAASLTDYFDGKIARERKLITNFGILMDPAERTKILVCSAFIAFVGLGWMHAWMVVIIVARRKLAITRFAPARGLQKSGARGGGLRQAQNHFADRGHPVDPRLSQLSRMGSGGGGGLWVRAVWPSLGGLVRAAVRLGGPVGLTLLSGALYLWRNREIIALAGFVTGLTGNGLATGVQR